jgi:hypothetical protein
MRQRLLADRVQMSPVQYDRKNNGCYRNGNRPVTDNLRLVLFEEIDSVPDFESKLVGLQLFTRDSSH